MGLDQIWEIVERHLPRAESRDRRGSQPTDKTAMGGDRMSTSDHRILRLARTIADVAGADTISAADLAEAIQYRRRIQV